MNTDYRCVTDIGEVKAYLAGHDLVSFDYETAPDAEYRSEEKAALDPAKAHICTMSLSVKEHTAIMIPVAHLTGSNMDSATFYRFLQEFLTDKSITKICHNYVFESSFSYKSGIVIQAPVYDTICAAQMTLKAPGTFRMLSDSGLKTLALNLCKDYTLNGPDYFVQTDDLDDIAVATGSEITYTVTVKSVDAAVIETATVNGDGSTTTGGAVTLTAKAVTPPQTFTLTFNPNWMIENVWQDGATPPTDESAFVNLTLTGDGTQTIRLDNSNQWGKTLRLDLRVADDSGNPITYQVSFNNNNDNKNPAFVNEIQNINPNSFTAENATDGTVTVTYKGIAKQQGGGNQSGQEVTVNANVSKWISWPSDGSRYYKSYETTTPPRAGTITLTVRDGNYGEIGTLTLSAENNWEASGTFTTSNGIHNQVGTAASNPIDSADATCSGTAITVVGYYPESEAQSLSAIGRSIKMAPKLASPMFAKAPIQSVTVVGENDLTPIDAVAVGDPITLSGTTWSHEWDNLPKVDENGDPIYYYVKELSANIPGDTEYKGTTYTYTKHNDEDAREGYSKITVTNKLKREEPEYGSVKVTKAFVGLPDGTLPTDFKITNNVNNTEFTVANTAGGTGTEADPYYWMIENLELGTEVTFTESGYAVPGYAVATVPAADATTKAVQATATSATTPGVATFKNTYTEKLKDFEFNKIWLPMTANLNTFTASDQLTWPTGAEITVEITRNNDSEFKLTYKLNGTSPEFEPESISGTTLTKEQLKLVKTGEKDYNFKLESAVLKAVYVEGSEEKEYVYTVKETYSPIDYAAKHYGQKDPESGGWHYKPDMVNGANNGDVIINQETGGYELPSTGGIGTTLFTALGGLMTAIAGATLTIKRKRKTA